jgi:hypothetical protein
MSHFLVAHSSGTLKFKFKGHNFGLILGSLFFPECDKGIDSTKDCSEKKMTNVFLYLKSGPKL